MRSRAKHCCRAFTFVELLVVLFIIALLIAILIPVIASARRSALVTKCGSNLRQIGQSIHSYVADHNRHPWASVMPAPFVHPHPSRVWPDPVPTTPLYDVLSPYLAPNSGVYRCSGDTGDIYDHCADASPLGYGISYVYLAPQLVTKGVRVDRMMWDYIGDDQYGRRVPSHRRAGSNVLYTDGSVTYYPGERPDSVGKWSDWGRTPIPPRGG